MLQSDQRKSFISYFHIESDDLMWEFLWEFLVNERQKCNLTNCIIGPGATVTGLTNSRDTTIGLEHDTDIVIE